jgi:hypothetical protein
MAGAATTITADITAELNFRAYCRKADASHEPGDDLAGFVDSEACLRDKLRCAKFAT